MNRADLYAMQLGVQFGEPVKGGYEEDQPTCTAIQHLVRTVVKRVESRYGLLDALNQCIAAWRMSIRTSLRAISLYWIRTAWQSCCADGRGLLPPS